MNRDDAKSRFSGSTEEGGPSRENAGGFIPVAVSPGPSFSSASSDLQSFIPSSLNSHSLLPLPWEQIQKKSILMLATRFLFVLLRCIEHLLQAPFPPPPPHSLGEGGNIEGDQQKPRSTASGAMFELQTVNFLAFSGLPHTGGGYEIESHGDLYENEYLLLRLGFLLKEKSYCGGYKPG